MQYLVLIYDCEANAAPMPTTPEGFEAMMAPWIAYDAELTEAGVLVGGNALEAAATARTVAVRDGESLITDGPFAETKEQLGGYYLLECADQDEALRWAAKCPGALTGRCEVRPIMSFD